LTQDTLERFLRAELTRRENLFIVRHLLTRCRRCLEVVQEADRLAGLRLTGAPPPRPLELVERLG
jgi:hypothetical protein